MNWPTWCGEETNDALRGLSDELLNISAQLQRSCNSNTMLRDRVEQMLHEQNWQLQQSSALIEEQKALCQDWRIIAQYWEIEMQHWQNHMQRWQRHNDSAAGPLMQTNTTASGR